MEYFIIGALAGLLTASVAWNVVLLRTRDDAARQVASVLDRVTSPVILPATPAVPEVDPKTPKYISDEPYHDEAWNEFRGETEDEIA
jgi:hypothetical protein